MKKILYCFVCELFVLLLCAGCGDQELPQGASKNEILTMEPVNQEKTMVTVHYELGIPYREMETLVEERFPQVDVVMVHDGSEDSEYAIRQNLLHGLECDIILSRGLSTVLDIAPDYLVDLSAEAFVGNYYMSAIDPCVDNDGKLYYLPGPSDVYGIVYDKTMFAENGWEVPHSYSEFTALIATINQAGLHSITHEDGESREVLVKAIQPSFKFADAFQIMFDVFSYDQVYRGVENQQWLKDYQSGKSSMVGHMEPAVDTLLRLREDGVFAKEDFLVKPRDRSRMLYQDHTTAMIFENQNAYTTNMEYASDESVYHEVGIFPFWTSDEPDSDYLYAIPSYYMAVNRKAAEKSRKKRELLLAIMAYLSESGTQEKLVKNGMQISGVQDVPIVENAFSEDVRQTIEEGRIIGTFSYAGVDGNQTVEWVLRDSACNLLEGKLSPREWLEKADLARDTYLSGQNTDEVYGMAEKSFTKLETAQLVGDMYRHETGAQIALVYVGDCNDGVTGFLYQGPITDKALKCFSPSRVSDEANTGIATGTFTGQQIMDYLSGKEGVYGERSYRHIVASGLLVEFAPWEKPGERLVSCKLPGGETLQPDAKYQVAYYAGSLKKEEDDTQGENFAATMDEKILAGTWEEHFISWLADIGGVVREAPLTTKLIWEQKDR